MSERSQGSIEYLLIAAAVLISASVAIYFLFNSSDFPAVSVTAVSPEGENSIRINVGSGKIAAGDWEWSISDNEGRYYEEDSGSWVMGRVWNKGKRKLNPPYVNLGEYSSGVYHLSLRHKSSGYSYFSDEVVQV